MYIFYSCDRFLFLLKNMGTYLNSCFDLNNLFDQFTMKALAKNGSLVGHLLEELSHITKFQLERRINIQF